MDSRAGRRAALHGRDAAPPHAGGDRGGLRPGHGRSACGAHGLERPGTPRSGAARCGAVRSMKLLVGIDPGVNTGVAVWDRGALDVRATAINDEMKLAATRALAALAKEDVPDSVRRAYEIGRASCRERV